MNAIAPLRADCPTQLQDNYMKTKQRGDSLNYVDARSERANIKPICASLNSVTAFNLH